MKLIIDIPEEIVKAIQNGKDYRYDIHTAIANGTPVLTEGDLISREALKRKLQYVYSCDYIGSKSEEGIVSDIIDEIDNAPTVSKKELQKIFYETAEKPSITECRDIATNVRDDYIRGYEQGFAEGYERASRKTPTFPMVSTSPAFVDIPQACKNCPSHPSNGGDGICHCTLGTKPVIC